MGGSLYLGCQALAEHILFSGAHNGFECMLDLRGNDLDKRGNIVPDAIQRRAEEIQYVNYFRVVLNSFFFVDNKGVLRHLHKLGREMAEPLSCMRRLKTLVICKNGVHRGGNGTSLVVHGSTNLDPKGAAEHVASVRSIASLENRRAKDAKHADLATVMAGGASEIMRAACQQIPDGALVAELPNVMPVDWLRGFIG